VAIFPELHRMARRPLVRWLVRGSLAALLVILVLFGAAGAWVWSTLRGSLPLLEGEVEVPELDEPVRIERDARGVPTLYGASRADLAFATGFLHGQERFFQMDLSRRRAAGELAALFGPPAVPVDIETRRHRFREVAARAHAAAGAEHRTLLDAYAAGVNSGLAALDTAPPEYVALRTTPRPWTPEDTILVLLSMFLLLQDDDGSYERQLATMRDALPAPLFAFLAPAGTEWDAPIDASTAPPIVVPGPDVIDLRAAAPATPAPTGIPVGSNNWAVAGEHTAHTGALLANDMHLPLGLPTTWYRASLVLERADDPRLQVTGATLPGTPAVVVGSNGRVAWGFTNSYGDFSDVVLVETVEGEPARYRAPGGPRPFDVQEETITVAGGAARTITTRWTTWGPVLGKDHRGRPYALRWTAHEPAALNLALVDLERAATVEQALDVAARAGIPGQNIVVVDAGGRIGWTIAGRLPRRAGFDGRWPASWADGERRWDGWIPLAEHPRFVDPPAGRIWTANARVVGGPMLEIVGRGHYALGARAAQVRDRLFEIEAATEADMLALQLDDRALFLERWRGLLVGLLDEEALANAPARREVRRLVADWGGRATPDSAGYRFVRAFRREVARRALEPLAAPARELDPDLRVTRLRQYEGPLWALVTRRPPHLLDPEYASWRELLLAAADETHDVLTAGGRPLGAATWGERNLVQLQHPLSRAVPVLGRWLDLEPRPLPGDSFMPRVQGPGVGASQRMVVSPGREDEGIFHMPGGQSGHFLSPYYGAGHEEWEEGRASPFLPGPTVHTLELRPVAPR
jgi:penicillin amidase